MNAYIADQDWEASESQVHLYCHIPFCRSRCQFCCYMSSLSVEEMCNISRLDEYVGALVAEIRGVAPSARPRQSIVFGGGTPSLLTSANIRDILDALETRFPDTSPQGVTMSFEASPAVAELERLRGFRENGFNRVSIGAQALEEAGLKLLGRPYHHEDVATAVLNARKLGFGSINLDLMMGFPGHQPDQWRETVERALALEPESVSINPFLGGIADAGGYVDRMRKQGRECPPEDIKTRMLDWAWTRLWSLGYANSFQLVFTRTGHDCAYIWDTFATTRNVVAFGPGTKGFDRDHLLLSDMGLSRYINNPGAGVTRHPYRDHFPAFIRNSFIGQGGVSAERTVAIFGLTLEEGVAGAPVVRELVQNLRAEGLVHMQGQDLALDSKRRCAAVLRVLAHYDRNWA